MDDDGPVGALPRYIELETSRRCNRTCEWCPNSEQPVRREQELMDWSLFAKVVDELASLNYTGFLANHNYNEPLLNPRMFDELDHVRQVLPTAKPAIYTNGDVLREPMMTRILDSGVHYLRVTRYPHRADTPATFEALHAWTRRAGLKDWQWEQRTVRQGLALVRHVGDTTIEIIGPDIIGTYNNRGGAVTGLPMLASPRRDPCLMTATSASIDFRGRLKMCCCVYPDTADHAGYVIGDLADASFAELWNGEQMTSYRHAHARADWSLSPACRSCTQPLPETRRAGTDA
ncbi:MAG: radical SAM/SPASM domain-containing protein [Pseudonocardia sp.]